jgi:hypothetical protein
MGGNASFAHIAQMIVPCVSSASRDCAKKRIIALVLFPPCNLNLLGPSGILDRSLSQAQHLSQFLEVMIQLLNRGSAAVRLSVTLMHRAVTFSRSNRL